MMNAVYHGLYYEVGKSVAIVGKTERTVEKRMTEYSGDIKHKLKAQSSGISIQFLKPHNNFKFVILEQCVTDSYYNRIAQGNF